MDIVSLGGETAALDADHGFDAETFKQFISFDVGDGDPIYYHSVGKLYRQPGGEIIAGVEALVSNRLVKMEGNKAARCCSKMTAATSSANTPTSSLASN